MNLVELLETTARTNSSTIKGSTQRQTPFPIRLIISSSCFMLMLMAGSWSLALHLGWRRKWREEKCADSDTIVRVASGVKILAKMAGRKGLSIERCDHSSYLWYLELRSRSAIDSSRSSRPLTHSHRNNDLGVLHIPQQ